MHAVETMTFANATPWHGLGTQLPEGGLRNWHVAAQAAGLDWTVEPRPLLLDNFDGTTAPVPTHVANVRTSDNSILGVVSKKFRVLQNSEAFEWFQPILESGDATIESAGSLFNGKRIWVLAKIADAAGEVRDGDLVRRYVLLAHAHDGSLCAHGGLTDIRVVCHNTLTLAKNSEQSSLIRLRHTKNIVKNLDEVRKALDVTRNGFFATLDQYRKLADKGINQADIRRYVTIIFEPKLKTDGTPESLIVAQNIEHIVDLAYTGKGNGGSTLWDAYNAVTEYTSWERGRTADGRINSLWFGDSAKLNQKSLSTALELVS